MLSKKLFYALLLCLFVSVPLLAQDVSVSGKVSDDSGVPLPGVNVVVKGTSTGTVTSADGSYSVSAPSDATLVFSSVGFVTQEVAINGQSSIDITLLSDAQQLGEVVVVGYGTQEKKEITSAVVSVKSEDFNQGNINTPAQLLQGKAAGVSIYNRGGD